MISAGKDREYFSFIGDFFLFWSENEKLKKKMYNYNQQEYNQQGYNQQRSNQPLYPTAYSSPPPYQQQGYGQQGYNQNYNQGLYDQEIGYKGNESDPMVSGVWASSQINLKILYSKKQKNSPTFSHKWKVI